MLTSEDSGHPAAELLDPNDPDEVALVTAALHEAAQPRQSSKAHLLALLAISLVLFVGQQHASAADSVMWIVVLVGVLLVHELGHLLAMRAFGYADLKVFFIPFFGAAASGRKRDANATQRAIVLLMGPLPGIVFAFVAACFGPYDDPWMRTTLTLALFINAFNLLPLAPLDGGRLLEDTLLSRWPRARRIARRLSGLALLGLGWTLDSWVLMGLGVFVFLFVFGQADAAIAEDLAPHLREDDARAVEFPAALVPIAIASVNRHVLGPVRKLRAKPTHYANVLYAYWERAAFVPPSAGRAAALLLAYLSTIGLVFATLVVLGLAGQGFAGPCEPAIERERLAEELKYYGVTVDDVAPDRAALDTKLAALEDCPALPLRDSAWEKREALRTLWVDALLERHPFDPPACLVDDEIEVRIDDVSRALAARNVSLRDVGSDPQRLRLRLRDDARHDVRAQLAVDRIASGVDVEIDEAEVARRVDEWIAGRELTRGDLLPEVVTELEDGARAQVRAEAVLDVLRTRDPTASQTTLDTDALQRATQDLCAGR